MKRLLKKYTSFVIAAAVILSLMPSAFSAPYAYYTDKNGARLTIDDSLSAVYDLTNSQFNHLPKFSCRIQGCDALAELGNDGQTIVVTFDNWQKYTEDIICSVFTYKYESMSKSVTLQDMPVTFVAPNGKFKMYTDNNGSAVFELSRAEADKLTAKPTEEPTEAPTQKPTQLGSSSI